MTEILVVDDLRVLTDTGDAAVTYARSLDFGLYLLKTESWDEVYLDHDLGGVDTIRPLVTWLEEQAYLGCAPTIGTIYIVTASPVGARWMEAGLQAYDTERYEPDCDYLTYEESEREVWAEKAALKYIAGYPTGEEL